MQVSDYIAKFLKNNGVKKIFAVTGGASLHLIHSAKKQKGLELVFPISEQACAMAAEMHYRVSGNIGAAFATSGPGATNLATGICGAFFDSIPSIYITGQVSTSRSNKGTGTRQIGFQETNCVEMYKGVTKYCVKIDKAEDIRFHLEKAIYKAKNSRMGPVLIDVPDDIQRKIINPKKLKSYRQNKIKKKNNFQNTKKKISKMFKMLLKAKRHIIVLVWGIHLSDSYKEIEEFIKKTNIPAVSTWAVAHTLDYSNPLNIGTWGTHGTRYGNYAVQNSDLILSIGSRLDTKATGSPITTFARSAKKIIVDIDKSEINKFKTFGLRIDLSFNQDCKRFLQNCLKFKWKLKKNRFYKWKSQILIWRKKYPICLPKYFKEKEINPYVFIDQLSNQLNKDDIICVDTGCTIAWTMQAFKFKKGQRLFHDFNNTAMGWSVPAAISASLLKKKRVILLTGDGSLSCMINEISLIKKHNLSINIFLLNNDGQSMIRQTQDQWLSSNYLGSSHDGGLAKINFCKVVNAFGIQTTKVKHNNKIRLSIKECLKRKQSFCEVVINKNKRVVPQVIFGRPNEDQYPLLPINEYYENMIIRPIKR
jgi:acetolactate synthase-1/2/3 large subunit